MGIAGIIFYGFILALISTIFIIALNTFIVQLVTKLLRFKEFYLKKAFKFAFFSGLFNLLLSLLVFPFKNLTVLLQVIGVAAFLYINYRLAVWIYEKATKRQKVLLMLIVSFFTLVLGFFITLLIAKVLETLKLAV